MSQSQEGMPQQPTMPTGDGPYPPINWSLGGRPSVGTDVPITAVLLVFYIAGAVGHMTLFQLNRRRGHLFIFSGLLFGFCMARITTCVLRIAWVCKLTNLNLAIAAQIFVAAGVILIYVANLFFAQRILRARHPSVGWHKGVKIAFVALLASLVVGLAMVVTVTVQSFFTLSTNTHRIDRDVQLAVGAWFFVIALLPVPVLAVTLLVPARTPIDKFGRGRFRHQVAIVLLGSATIALGAGYRFGTTARDPVPLTEPQPDYFARAAFYVVNFVLEILVLFFYLFVRIDLRFHVPNGAKGPGSYSLNARQQESAGDVESKPVEVSDEDLNEEARKSDDRGEQH